MFKDSQTKLLGVVGLLGVLAGALYYALTSTIHKSGKFIILALIPLIINMYTVHCVINGKCTMYSWFLTLVFTFYAACIFYMYGQLAFKKLQSALMAKQQASAAASMQAVAEKTMGISGF